jgi:hypothetical protein
VLGNLLQRFWLESQGLQQINLESFQLHWHCRMFVAMGRHLVQPGLRGTVHEFC